MTRKKHLLPLSLLLVFLLSLFPDALPARAETLVGKAVSVSGGDSITVMDINKRRHKIHLYGVACPKKDQPFVKEAGRHTAKLVSQKKIMVRVYGKDRFGNKSGLVFADGILVNESLIKNGLAWQYRDQCRKSFCKEWLTFEKNAKAKKVGLWKYTDPIPPWQ